MKPITLGVLIGLEVLLGKWSKDKTIGIEDAIGAFIIILFMMLLDNFGKNELGIKIGYIALLTTTIIYIPSIVKRLGY